MSDRPLHLHGTLLPRGDRGEVYVVDGRITFEYAEGAETLITDGYLLPGLVDAHAHLALASPAPRGTSLEEAVRASAREQLGRGVLAIREPGGPSRDSCGIGPEEGLPRVISGGRFLAAPGGYFPGMAREVPGDGLAAAARDEFEASGHWAKIVGDFFDEDGRIAPTFDERAICEAVEAVHAAGGRVAIHAMAGPTIEQAIVAGVDSIEHATELLPEHLADIDRAGIALVPTMLIGRPAIEALIGMGSSGSEVRRWEQAFERQPEMVRRAAAEGIAILAGTDAGMVAHGLVLEEVGRLLSAGIDADVALGAGSWAARRWLGLPGLEEGAPADIVAFAHDPRVPHEAGRPVVRILDGRLVEG